MTVQRGQTIAFANDLPHGGREDNTRKEVYHLYAYIVSYSGVFHWGQSSLSMKVIRKS
jgi:hypothetical protein